MQIRSKLVLLIILFSLALTVNLLALGYLGKAALAVFSEMNQIHQKLSNVNHMQAQLRGAEAAIYRYLMEGVPGFAEQFENHLEDFSKDIQTYETGLPSSNSQIVLSELQQAYRNSSDIGKNLINLHDEIVLDLDALHEKQDSVAWTIEQVMAVLPKENVVAQQQLTEMDYLLPEISMAIMDYMLYANAASRAHYTELIIDFYRAYREFNTHLEAGTTITEPFQILPLFTEFQTLGSQLISLRDQQEAFFANFALLMYHTSQEVLAGQVQKEVVQNLADVQNRVSKVLTTSIIISFSTAIFVVLIAGFITLPLERRMNFGISALVQGADRVTAGDYSSHVHVSGTDELHKLAESFNKMMTEIQTRETRLTARLSELESIRLINLEMTRSLEIRDVLNTIAQNALKLVNASEVHISIVEGDRFVPSLIANAWRDENNHPSPRMPRPDGLVATVARTQKPIVINMAQHNPKYSSYEIEQWDVKAVAAFPLKIDETSTGVFYLSYDDRTSFSEDELWIIELLSDQANIALKNARLFTNLSEKELRLKNMAQKLVNVQEAERRLIGLDLHDGLMQLLLSTNMHLDTLTSILPDLDSQGRGELMLTHNRLKDAIAEVRQVVSDLRPAELEEGNLVEGLREYLIRTREMRHWQIEFKADPADIKIHPDVEIALFRIAQEALTNAYRHGKASKVLVHLHQREGAVVLEVQDWGKGFDLTLLSDDKDHLGLIGMRERAALLGGTLKIQSQPGEGTRIVVRIPNPERLEGEQ